MSPKTRWAEGTRPAPARRPAGPRRWLTVAQAAELTGFGVRTIRNRIAAGDLPAYLPRGSRVLRIDARDLDDFMTDRGRVPAAHLGNGGDR
jgi:excisionase family DNA binding protein